MLKQSDVFFHNLDAADLHVDHGKHDEHATGFVDGQLSATVWPDMAADVDARNGWTEPEDDQREREKLQFENAAECVTALLVFLSAGETLEGVGRRGIALGLALAPGIFGTFAEAARRFGCTKQGISKYTSELSDLAPKFAHGLNFRGVAARERQREIAIAIHARLKHKARLHELDPDRFPPTGQRRDKSTLKTSARAGCADSPKGDK